MEKYAIPITYAVKHKNEECRINSRSGGIFTALTDYVLNKNGRVYGCIINEKNEVAHIGTDKFEERDKMRGSKYVQSNLGNIFQEVKDDLKQDILVLFSGTSCQIDGLYAFLGKEYNNLICIDIVCHGVPSPKVWKDYVEWQEKRNNGTCINADFRNKKDFGWNSHIETLSIKNNDNIKNINSRVYTNLFYSHFILRPSCYKCPYKSTIHPGNITIADYWGIDKIEPKFNDNKGVSLILINDKRGKELFEDIEADLLYIKTDINDSLQPPLIGPFPEPSNRDKFWKKYNKSSFEEIARKYGEFGYKWEIKKIFKRIKRKIKKIIKR